MDQISRLYGQWWLATTIRYKEEKRGPTLNQSHPNLQFANGRSIISEAFPADVTRRVSNNNATCRLPQKTETVASRNLGKPSANERRQRVHQGLFWFSSPSRCSWLARAASARSGATSSTNAFIWRVSGRHSAIAMIGM